MVSSLFPTINIPNQKQHSFTPSAKKTLTVKKERAKERPTPATHSLSKKKDPKRDPLIGDAFIVKKETPTHRQRIHCQKRETHFATATHRLLIGDTFIGVAFLQRQKRTSISSPSRRFLQRTGDGLASIHRRREGDALATIQASHSAAQRRCEGDNPSVALSGPPATIQASHSSSLQRHFGDAPSDALATVQLPFTDSGGFCCGRYLVVAVSLQSLWSLTLAILDAYAILIELSNLRIWPVKIIDPHLVSSFFDDYKRVYLHATTELENRCAWVAECSLNIQVTTGVEGNICLVGHLQTNTCHSLLDHVCNIHFLRSATWIITTIIII
nr:mannosylglycoprotein endo-beta-mannosidase [Quercus suber]